MSAGKLTWGRRDWLGLMVLFLSSIAADVIGALLAVKGILPMGSVAAWVYVGWALGAFLGVRVAVRGRSGTVQASLLLAAGAYVLIWLVGLTVFGTAAFAHHGLGITLAVVAGALLGAVLGRGDGIEKRSLFGGDGNIEGRYRVFHGENHENLSVRHFLLDGP